MSEMTSFEFHFSEGFRGQTVSVEAAEGLFEFKDLQTEFQTGLARIETLELKPEKEIVIKMAKGQEVVVRLSAQDPYILIVLVAGKLTVSLIKRRPGYV